MQRRTFLSAGAVAPAVLLAPGLALGAQLKPVRLVFSRAAWEDTTPDPYSWESYLECLDESVVVDAVRNDENFDGFGWHSMGAHQLRLSVKRHSTLTSNRWESIWIVMSVSEATWNLLAERELYLPDEEYRVCLGKTQEEADSLRKAVDARPITPPGKDDFADRHAFLTGRLV